MRRTVGTTICFVILLLAVGGVSQAKTVLMMSDCWDEVEPHDQGFEDLLEAAGYTVGRPSTDPQAMSPALQAEANGYDLVLVGRHTNPSSAYASNSTEVDLWNGITAPMIMMNGYLGRTSRWSYLNTSGYTNTSLPLSMTIRYGSKFFVWRTISATS